MKKWKVVMSDIAETDLDEIYTYAVIAILYSRRNIGDVLINEGR